MIQDKHFQYKRKNKGIQRIQTKARLRFTKVNIKSFTYTGQVMLHVSSKRVSKGRTLTTLPPAVLMPSCLGWLCSLPLDSLTRHFMLDFSKFLGCPLHFWHHYHSCMLSGADIRSPRPSSDIEVKLFLNPQLLHPLSWKASIIWMISKSATSSNSTHTLWGDWELWTENW